MVGAALRLPFRALRIAALGLAVLAVLIAHAWSVLALHFGIAGAAVPVAAQVVYAGATAFLAIRLRRRRGFLWSALLVVPVAAWWSGIEPVSGGRFPPETGIVARATFGDDGTVTVHGVRDFRYRSETDFDARREDRTYPLDGVRTVDLLGSYWDGNEAIAHTMLSFGFADGRQLAVSVEIRRELDETYDTLKGLFKQYEIIYVWGDERDLVELRTNHRRERVFLYRTTCTPAEARLLLADMLEETDRIARRPVYYHTLARNCTTSLIMHVNQVLPRKIPWWTRRFLNGYGDRRAYDQGWLAGSLPFEDLKRRADIGERARAGGGEFSARIRTHLRSGS